MPASIDAEPATAVCISENCREASILAHAPARSHIYSKLEQTENFVNARRPGLPTTRSNPDRHSQRPVQHSDRDQERHCKRDQVSGHALSLRLDEKWRGMIADGRRDHFGREPYPLGARGAAGASVAAAPAGTFARAGQYGLRSGRLGRRRACDDARCV